MQGPSVHRSRSHTRLLIAQKEAKKRLNQEKTRLKKIKSRSRSRSLRKAATIPQFALGTAASRSRSKSTNKMKNRVNVTVQMA